MDGEVDGESEMDRWIHVVRKRRYYYIFITSVMLLQK